MSWDNVHGFTRGAVFLVFVFLIVIACVVGVSAVSIMVAEQTGNVWYGWATWLWASCITTVGVKYFLSVVAKALGILKTSGGSAAL